MSAYLDLGGVGKKVTTSSADCQLWMDRGIVHTFGFNHEEAIRCFQTASTCVHSTVYKLVVFTTIKCYLY